MLILLAVLVSAESRQPPVKFDGNTRVSVVIVESGTATGRNWDPGRYPSQREIVLKEVDGRRHTIRLTEYQ